ncbi:hypothetical protein ABZ958_03225 [Streptomyces sp. NPDC046237]|uniref:hypothetical protein n=1 Tax=Streptomyces sp. NPDC046237 TaxID=3154914 RepID=UPI0033F06D4C
MIPAPAGITLVILVAVAIAGTIRRIRRADTAAITAFQHRVRTVDQVMDDLATWRADRKTREAIESLALCEALYALPTHIPQQRKETGQ